ncbi:MAG: hypothetical protein ACD_31C00005G0007 [uncultured bacterium]|nr:MAG: hypothetical protein ACD_31C00005G0007 [uncultured bacterium]KKQ15711.1 MAG: hypothetical protein US28_C0011G0007 [Candidatus Daviesbacteria bacterium GW2011_GWA1_36_8]
MLIKIIKYWYILVLIIFSLTPIIWFIGREGYLINGVDTNFPLDPLVWFVRRIYVWNPVLNAGLDFSSSSAGLFFHLIQVVPYLMNLNLQWVEIISLVFWFSLLVSSSFFFATLFIKNRLAQIILTCFYVFNIYLFNTWENVKVANLSLMAGIPMFFSILILLKENKVSRLKGAYLAIILGVLVTGTGINPAYFFTLFFIALIFFFGLLIDCINRTQIFSCIKDFLLVSILVILINSFWVLPTSDFILRNISPEGSIDKIGFTNWVDSLSDNTSVLNIMRLQGAWDWYAYDSVTGLPLYIPYSLNYFHRVPFLFFSFLIPSLIILSLIFRKKGYSHLYISFALMFVIGVFLGAGTHLPTGSFYSFLYYHLPFFTMFRSPWYIFSSLIVVSSSGMIALLFDHLVSFESRGKFSKLGYRFLLILMIISNLVYAYPLVTGRIFRPQSQDGFYVKFPEYVLEARRWAESNPEGRIINYPEDEIEKFEWGYRGIESILALFTNKEVLFSPLNVPDAPIAKIIKQFYTYVYTGESEAAFALASKLNLHQIFLKNDQTSILLSLHKNFLGLSKDDIGKWSFYNLPENAKLGKFYAADKVYVDSSKNLDARILSILEREDILVNSDDKVINSISGLSNVSGRVVTSKNSQYEDFYNFLNTPSRFSNRLVKRDLSTVNYEFDIQSGGSYQVMLDRYKIEEFGLKTSGIQKALLDGKDIDLKILKNTDSYIFYEKLNFEQGNHNLVLKLENKNLINNSGFDINEPLRTNTNGELSFEQEGKNQYLKLVNKTGKDYYVSYPIKEFDPLIGYMVSFKYRQIYGNLAQLLIGQSNEQSLFKTQIESLPYYPDWQSVSLFYDPVKTVSKLEVSLIAPYTKDALGTTIHYDDIEVYKLFNNNLILLQDNETLSNISPNIAYKKNNPTDYKVYVKNAKDPHIIVFSENYSPSWDVKLLSVTGRELNIRPFHFSANYYANAWYIESVPGEYFLSVFYKPQQLFYLGFFITIITPFFVFLIFKLFPLSMRINLGKFKFGEVAAKPVINFSITKVINKKND